MFRSNIKFFLAFFAATMIFVVVQAYAVWQDAPAAPAQYGAIGSGQEQDDYKPVNLGNTIQTKTGGLNILGNVGIGTTTPSVPSGSGASKVLEISDSADPAFVITDTGTLDAKWGILNSGGNLEFYKQGLGNSFILQADGDAIINTGNVGIGTTNPSGELEIKNPNNTDDTSLWITSGGYWYYIVNQGSDGSVYYASDEGRDQIFKVRENSTTYWDALTIKSNGNVGIGTTDPGAYRLNVVGDAKATRFCFGADCRDSWSAVAGTTPTLDSVTTNGNTTTNTIYASGFYDTQDDNYYIDPNGVGNAAVLRSNVTVGGTLNASALQQSGIAVCLSNGTNCQAGTTPTLQVVTDQGKITTQDITASAFYVSSDARLKKNVETLSGALGKIGRARGVSYDLASGQGVRQIGVIAQELEQEFPELVITDGNGYKAVAYDRLSAVLIEAIKELQSQNQALQSRLDLLEKKW